MAHFDVSEFTAQISNTGFLQTNKYVVVISPNNKLSGSFINTPKIATNFKQMGNELQYRCINATLPGIILRTADNNRMGLGVMEKMPFSAVYTDVDLTFLCDKNGAAYNFWYGWLNYIFASVGKESVHGVTDKLTSGTRTNGQREYYTTQYKDNYSSIIDVIVFDNFGEPAIGYKLYTAYPISINDTPISWGDNNNLLKITVKITFREWALDEGKVLLQNTKAGTFPNSPGDIFTP
jgi:hypothetical protein